MRGTKDLTGLKFNELTVIKFKGSERVGERTENKWICKCSCGEDTIASTRELQKGRKKSCGHLNNSRKKKAHRYEEKDDYVIVYTHKDEPFFIDTEDLQKVLTRTWFKHRGGYICCKIDNKMMQLHRFLLNPPNNRVVDHINHVLTDNRKGNLRVCEHKENSKNLAIAKNNTSGVTGVFFDKNWSKWMAQITVDYNQMNLGGFDKKEDAIQARKKAEDKFFGEFKFKKEEELPLPLINI